MSISINYKNSSSKKPLNNLVLFTDEKFDIKPLKKHIKSKDYNNNNNQIKTKNLKEDLFVF